MTWENGKLVPLTEERRLALVHRSEVQALADNTPAVLVEPIMNRAEEKRWRRMHRSSVPNWRLYLLGVVAVFVLLGFLVHKTFWLLPVFFLFYLFISRELPGSHDDHIRPM